MDPEKVLAWFKTEEGAQFARKWQADAIKAECDAGNLIAKSVHENLVKSGINDALATEQARQKLLADAAEIASIDGMMTVERAQSELARYNAGPEREAAVRAMKSEAKLNASRNTPARRDDPSKLTGNTSLEDKFEALVKSGDIVLEGYPGGRAQAFRTFKQQAANAGVLV